MEREVEERFERIERTLGRVSDGLDGLHSAMRVLANTMVEHVNASNARMTRVEQQIERSQEVWDQRFRQSQEEWDQRYRQSREDWEETKRLIRESGKRIDERIEKLVSAIGEFMRR
jgi:hypothetical protein